MQDINDEPYIPHEISRLAIYYSIPFIWLSGAVSYMYNQKIMAYLQFVVYITSILFWYHISKNNIIRYIDITAVVICFAYATYLSNYCLTNTKHIWNRCLITCITVFVINEITFFVGIEYSDDDNIKKTFICYQSVFIHMIFLHIFPTITSMYCVIYG